MVEATENYQVPFTYRKHFSPEQVTEMINAFKHYDANGNGTIDAREFKAAIKSMGHDDITEEQVGTMLASVDKNEDGVIEWVEFLDLMQKIKTSGQSFGQAIQMKDGAAAAALQTAGGGQHTYLREEVSLIARTINRVCKDDTLVQERLPIDPETDDLFHACSDGMILIHLINHIEKDTIDMRTVNKGSNLNIYKVRENLDQAFTAAKGMIKVIGVDAQSFLDKTSYLMLGVLWQLVRLLAFDDINLKDCPEIWRLMKEGEELSDLQKLKSEEILLRWVNFHLAKAEQPPANNLGGDLKDSKKLIYVLNQLDNSQCSLDALEDPDDLSRATRMIDDSKKIGVEDTIGPKDLVKGNGKVNSVFVAAMFNAKHGLEELTQEEFEAAGIIDDDIEGTREERAFRMWINSLQIGEEDVGGKKLPAVFIDNLYEEVRDGLVILRVCHRINNAVVDWGTVNLKPKNMFDRNANCDKAEQAMRDLGVRMVGVGSQDIREGNHKNILAMVWQLMRVHYLQIIGSKTENDLIQWVNEVAQPESPITKFNDAGFADGKILIKLCASVEPRIVNWDLVTEGATEEDRELNAKYAISIARKLGSIIFLVWDDIPKLNKKMILIFVCSIYDLKHNIQ